MYRIAHISDLHLDVASQRQEKSSALQWIAKAVGREAFGAEVEARGHSETKLDALKIAIRNLQPDLIVVTGDITNFGDRESFEEAKNVLDELSATSRDKVLCVPGNHDSLMERVANLSRSPWTRRLLNFLSLFVREVDEPLQRARVTLQDALDGDEPLSLLGEYRAIIGSKFGAVDPSKPHFVKTDFGEIAFFLFNSTNDPGLMANQGHIGIKQFNKLNEYCQDRANVARLATAVRIALLHHHPITAPDADGSAAIRAYDWMVDGPRFLQHLNRYGFHLILHGHEHQPFHCTINYGGDGNVGLHIAAAGSATQGESPRSGSFNVLDVLSPILVRLQRYDYSPTGYDPLQPSFTQPLPIRPLNRIRLSPVGTADTPADTALRNLIQGREEAYDDRNAYEMIEFNAVISSTQLYQGKYRRKGKVACPAGDRGPVFLITGSPSMEYSKMKLGAFDSLTTKTLATEKVVDDPYQKVIRVLHPVPLKQEQEFDVTLKFEWQASDWDPNDFDAFNLMSFKHSIAMVKYRVSMPWQPAQARVEAYGFGEAFTPELTAVDPPARSGTGWTYGFSIRNPKKVAYLVMVGPGV